MQTETSKSKRILIIKLGSIGDVVMATPVAKAIRQAYPDAYIAWAVEEKSSDVLIGNPYLDDVIILRRKWSSKTSALEAIGTIAGINKSLPAIRAGKFDITIDLQGLLRSALVGLLSGAKCRIGFDSAGEGAPLLYTQMMKTSGKKIRGPLDYLNPLKLININSDDVDMLVPFSVEDESYIRNLIAGFSKGEANRPIAALCPSTTWPQKHWNEFGWAKLADKLASHYGMIPIFMGSSADIGMINRIQGMMKFESASAAGKTTINQAAAMLKECGLVVAVDTGLLHISVGLGRPTIGLFGPTKWDHLAVKPNFRVVSKDCPLSPCLRHPKCRLYDCMDAITPQDILKTAEGWLPVPIQSVQLNEGTISKCNEPNDLRPLRTVHVETGMHSLGGPIQVVYLLKGLKRRGHEALLVCAEGSGIHKQAIADGIDVYPIHLRTDLDVSFIFKLKSLLEKVKPDIVHLHSRRGADILGGTAARLANVPGVVLSRRIDNPINPCWLSRFKYSSLCDTIIAISDAVRESLLNGGVDSARIVRVRSAVDAESYQAERKPGLRNELGILENSIVIGIIAQLIERKGHKYLLDAMSVVVKKHPNAVLLILGEGQTKSKIENQSKELGISDNVILAGFRNDIPAVLREIDILVHPARMEGLGIAILQAMSAGIPVIASEVGGIPEAVKDGVNGILIPPMDSVAIQNALIRLLDDPALRLKMGAEGKRIVEEEFSVDCMVEGVLSVYRTLLKSKSFVK